MNENRRQILEMLSSGKITADEAENLIAALEKDTSTEKAHAENKQSGLKPKYLRVVVESEHAHHKHHGHHHDDECCDDECENGPVKVNIRVPMQLLRAGVKLASLIPIQARSHVNNALKEHGFNVDISQIKPENLEELIESMNDFTVDVNEKHNKVRIFCE